MEYKDGLHEVSVRYSTVANSLALNHRHTFDVILPDPPAIGTSADDINVLVKGGNTLSLSSVVGTYLGYTEFFYPTSVDYVGYDLYRYTGVGSEKIWVSGDLLALNGVNVGATQATQQMTFTFRTMFGNICRLVWLETAYVNNSLQTFPVATAAIQNYATYVISALSPVVGRDNGYLVRPEKVGFSSNAALYKRRNRIAT